MTLLILFLLSLAALVAVVFLLGFRLGGDHWQRRLLEVRLQAAAAERSLHNLTRQAFVAMAEEVERRRSPGS
ncbi:MAG: hypothetical protein QOF60_3105 [Actinomycetota bacterium]|jgi:uncharacterized membrane protein YciS (DUF1049 family)|nr:hypothetical protein [Actinomycetota bacterium]